MHVPRRRRKHFGWETFTRIKNDIYIHVYTYKRRIIPVLVRLRYSCWGTRSLLSVIYLFLSLTGGTPHSAKNFTLRFRQTPPVGRSEKARRHPTELQWSPNTNTSDLRYHCMENELWPEKYKLLSNSCFSAPLHEGLIQPSLFYRNNPVR